MLGLLTGAARSDVLRDVFSHGRPVELIA
jgi:hypothetical protein